MRGQHTDLVLHGPADSSAVGKSLGELRLLLHS